MILSVSPGGRAQIARSLTLAAERLDKVVLTLTPDPANPNKPPLQWGDALGIFEPLEYAANAFDRGRDGTSAIFTRRQAGPVIDALTADVSVLQALRDAALAIEEGAPLKGKSPAPTLGDTALADLTRAAVDARKAAALLTGQA